MRSQNFLFISFCLILLVGLMQSYALFQDYFSPYKEDQNKISMLKNQLEKEKLKRIIVQNELYDFRQEIATNIPELQSIAKDAKTYQLRSLASVSQAPISGFDLSKTLSERAKAEFREGKYDSAAQSFVELIKKYPTSPLVIESYFFMGESYFLSKKPQECLDVVDMMMSQFPDNELTGFLMLRMGQILLARGRDDEAKEVFATVGEKFSFNQELKNQAQRLERSSE